jgi:hypothetical protein
MKCRADIAGDVSAEPNSLQSCSSPRAGFRLPDICVLCLNTLYCDGILWLEPVTSQFLRPFSEQFFRLNAFVAFHRRKE